MCDCPDQEMLEQWLAQLLSEEQAASIERHVAECEGCAATVERLRKLDESIAADLRAGRELRHDADRVRRFAERLSKQLDE